MPTLVLGVPGLWRSRGELAAACAERGYLWAGAQSVVVDPRSRRPHPFSIECYDPDPALREAFEIASDGSIPEGVLDRIAAHTMTAYVVTDEAPSIDLCLAVMRFAGVLLDAGGLAVKVETAGLAHAAERWRALAAREPPALAAFQALTVRVPAEDVGETYSCGMHALAQPDAAVGGASPELAELVDAFNRYLLLEQSDVEDGHTFAARPDAPRYRLKLEPCRAFPPGDLFHNPLGVWRLLPV